MQKNTATKWIVFAFGGAGHASEGQPITGDAANITANIRIDGGAANAVDDVNPTELEDGYYYFDIVAAENNGDNILIAPESSTADVEVIGVPGAVYTTPASFNAGALALASVLGTATGADIATDLAALQSDTDDIQTRLPAALSSAGNITADVQEINATTVTGTGSSSDKWAG